MKFSISVPDALWAEVATDEDSPSEIVQTALKALVRERRQLRQSVWQPGPEIREANLETIERAAERLRSESKRLQELGYAAGARFAADNSSFGLIWLREFVFKEDPFSSLSDLISDPDYDLDGNPKSESGEDAFIYDAILRSAKEDLGWTYELSAEEPIGAALPNEYLQGIVEAIFDIWRVFAKELTDNESS